MKNILSRLKELAPQNWDPYLRQLLFFFGAVLVLTLFARGTAGSASAKVTVITPESKILSQKVHTPGTLTPLGSDDHPIPDGLVISEIKAKVGDTLSAGDILATVDAQALDELLTRQQAQLRQTQMQYESLLDTSEPSDEGLRQAKKQLTHAKETRDSLKARLSDAENALAIAEENAAAAPEEEQSAAQTAVTEAENAVASLKNQLADAEEAVSDASHSLTREQTAYSDALEQSRRDQESNKAYASILKLDIDKAVAYVSALQAVQDSGYCITTPKNGILATFPLAPEEATQNHSFSLSNPYTGKRLSFRLKEEEANFLTATSVITISRDEQSSNLTGGSKNPDPTDPEMVEITTVVLDNAWQTGPVSVQVLLWEERYLTCLPVTALRQDANGFFVYIVTQEANLWGIQQVTKRVDVEIVRLDAFYAAVNGRLDNATQVILSSSKPLTENSRVRVTP